MICSYQQKHWYLADHLFWACRNWSLQDATPLHSPNSKHVQKLEEKKLSNLNVNFVSLGNQANKQSPEDWESFLLLRTWATLVL